MAALTERLEALPTPWYVLLVAIVMVGTLAVLARAVANLRVSVARRESNQSLAPVPYGGSFRSWERVVDSLGVRAQWYVVVRGAPEPVICHVASTVDWSGLPGRALMLRVGEVAEGPAVAMRSCPVDPELPRGPALVSAQATVVDANADALFQGGLLVLDSAFTVVYAANGVSEMERAVAAVKLLAAP